MGLQCPKLLVKVVAGCFSILKKMSEVQGKTLFPQVQWAQRKHLVILRVLVKPVQVKQLNWPLYTFKIQYTT